MHQARFLLRRVAARVRRAEQLLVCTLALGAGACAHHRVDAARDSVVRVETRGSAGTGFFVEGPDGRCFVVTAFHVVEKGGRITVARQVKQNDTDAYVEAYPESRLVAYDRESDLALLEVPNLPADRMKPLALGVPKIDRPISSYGFPATSLTTRELGIMRKTGTLSNVAFLPVIDWRTGRVVKENAVKAVIVSSALEPGFSGGPTLDEEGKVVGINVVKDKAHVGQDGAVHVEILAKLLKSVRAHAAPTTDEVSRFLTDVKERYLDVGVTERSAVPESDFLGLNELLAVREVAEGLLAKEAGIRIRMTLSQLPGNVMQTFDSSPVRSALTECQSKSSAINALLGGTGMQQPNQCGELGIRPLAWGLAAEELGWDARTTGFEVRQVDEIDPVSRFYEAKVRTLGPSPRTLTLHLQLEGGRPKLRLFDRDGVLFAMKRGSDTAPEQLVGAWGRASSYVDNQGATQDTTEWISVGYGADGKMLVAHKFVSDRRGTTLRCEVRQHFAGKFDNGVIAASADTKSYTATDSCNGVYTQDTSATLKLASNGAVVMHRTDGATVDVLEFVRDPRRTR
ncbi:MAG: serine protease [Polyangiales bacterium]